MQDPMRHQFIVDGPAGEREGACAWRNRSLSMWTAWSACVHCPIRLLIWLLLIHHTVGGGYGFTGKERFGERFDKYRTHQPDRREVGIQVRKKIIAWDNAPGKEYFDELFRVSKQQIIWGGNYFSLPPCRCFLIWEKTNIPENFTMAQCEYAWTNIKDNAKIFKHTSIRAKDEGHFHPTEKPVSLYAWIYQKYAKPGDKILDTHLGSGSSRIAAYDAGLDFVGTEIDAEYFRLQEERWAAYTAQICMW